MRLTPEAGIQIAFARIDDRSSFLRDERQPDPLTVGRFYCCRFLARLQYRQQSDTGRWKQMRLSGRDSSAVDCDFKSKQAHYPMLSDLKALCKRTCFLQRRSTLVTEHGFASFMNPPNPASRLTYLDGLRAVTATLRRWPWAWITGALTLACTPA